MQKHILIFFLIIGFTMKGCIMAHAQTIRETFTNTTKIVYSEKGQRVNQTVAEGLKAALMPEVQIQSQEKASAKAQTGMITIGLVDEGFIAEPANSPDHEEWMYFRIQENGSGELVASKPHLLYTLFCQIRDDWLDKEIAQFRDGKFVEVSFPAITGRDDLLTGRMKFFRNRDKKTQISDMEHSFQELARLGCSHVVVNELGTPYGYETGPEGEIYYRFYDYLPDFDQFVETKLNRHTYPKEYLESNLSSLKLQSELAVKYGLTPGMDIANPRSVPESLLRRYPYLRGARVDHTWRAFEPRYTLTLAHPAVRWHYAELLRKLLNEIPELGFIMTLINDSGSGFEYTSSLYPGKNGGPYVVKEWMPDSVIAKAAAENVIRYYRMLRDVAHEINPDFRLVTGLKNIAEESEIILAGIDDGIDLMLRSQRSDVNTEHWNAHLKAFRDKGSEYFTFASGRGSLYVLGVPSPWQTYSDLKATSDADFRRIGVEIDPPYLVPYSVNREVVRAFQLDPEMNVDAVVKRVSVNQVGEKYAAKLQEIWQLADQVVEAAPIHALYSGLGFTWYRFWVRPFVPDIGAIPESEREYYERYMLSHFNNPHNVDFAADMLWTIENTRDSEKSVKQFDTRVWQSLDKAISLAQQAVKETSGDNDVNLVFVDTQDRLIAYRCYSKTVRNMFAWIAGVHGYLRAEDKAEKESRLRMVQEMVASELENTKALLKLWETSKVDFMPVNDFGETMHHYGLNFGDHLKTKIALMEKYGDRKPYIDPDFMWRMPEGTELDEKEYMNY